MRITIITVNYNNAIGLEKTICSVIQQSYSNIEYIIIDGGSTDNSIDIIKKYENKITYWVSEKDSGVYDAMNKGIKKSTGDYILFLGSDDKLWDKDIIATIFNNIEIHKYDFIYGNVNSPDLGENYDGAFTVKKIFSKNICHQAIFYKQELFKKYGLYNVKYKVAADHAYNIKCILNKRIKKLFIPITIAFYAPGGLSATVKDHLFIKDRRLIIAQSAFPHYLLLSMKKYLSHFKNILFTKIFK